MKLIRTKGRGAQEAVATIAAIEQRGGSTLDTVLPVVRRIVRDVRKHGDRVLLRYAAEFDGLKDEASLRVTSDEMAAAWKDTDPSSPKQSDYSGNANSSLCSLATTCILEQVFNRRPDNRPTRAST